MATLERALELGVTFWDTAEMYGWGANEALLGRVPQGRRDQVTIATKFGVDPTRPPDDRAAGLTAAGQRPAPATAPLHRLGIDHIDLYYQHRPDPDMPIEETVGAMAEQIRAGKIRYLGLSEVDPGARPPGPRDAPDRRGAERVLAVDPRRRGGAVPVQRELGIGIVPYSPLGRGFLTGRFTSAATSSTGDFRATSPRFRGERWTRTRRSWPPCRGRRRHGATPEQVALAWVLPAAMTWRRSRDPPGCLPGAERGRGRSRLTDEDLAELDAAGRAGRRRPLLSPAATGPQRDPCSGPGCWPWHRRSGEGEECAPWGTNRARSGGSCSASCST